MELLLELLLTTVLSVLVAFLLGKIVSVAAPDGDVPDAPCPAEGAMTPSDSGPRSPKVAASASRVVSGGEAVGKPEAVSETGEGPHAEGRDVAAALGGDCVLTDEDRRIEEIVHTEENELVVEGVVLGTAEARAEELVLNEADDREKILDATDEEMEENLISVTPAETEDAVKGFSVEEKIPLTSVEGQVVGIVLSRDEESGVAEGSDSGEVGTESAENVQRPARVEIDDVKVYPFGAAKEVELKSGEEGNGTSAEHEKVGSFFNDDGDWEGIEKSNLEKLFGAATAFVDSAKGIEAMTRLSSDLQMQLYGLRKIATEGPCYESQPLALKVSARAKWHSWQRLGTMNLEMAMEKYITLLSDNIPGWMPQEHRADGNPMEEGGCSPVKWVSGLGAAFSSSEPEDQLIQTSERKGENPYSGECNVAGVSQGSEQGIV